jgi:hypothetical protein
MLKTYNNILLTCVRFTYKPLLPNYASSSTHCPPAPQLAYVRSLRFRFKFVMLYQNRLLYQRAESSNLGPDHHSRPPPQRLGACTAARSEDTLASNTFQALTPPGLNFPWLCYHLHFIKPSIGLYFQLRPPKPTCAVVIHNSPSVPSSSSKITSCLGKSCWQNQWPYCTTVQRLPTRTRMLPSTART